LLASEPNAGHGSTFNQAFRAIRQLTRINNDLKSARIAVIRDGEHHDENREILRGKAPSHMGGFTEGLSLGATTSEILEALMVVANEEFETYIDNLPHALKSRLLEACAQLSSMPKTDGSQGNTPGVLEGGGVAENTPHYGEENAD
jgi:hypothetical protein